MKILAGTSGYSYKEWKGPFYPEDLSSQEMLNFYSRQLPAVEINNTFYRLPKASVLETWLGQVPKSFRFVLKASRRITHMKRLKEPGDETDYLFKTVAKLGTQLGVILFQLPPYLKKDIERLSRFLEYIPKDVRSAFEFRHETWFDDETYEMLRKHKAGLCLADTEEIPLANIIATTDWGYLRMRRMGYDTKQLKKWKTRRGLGQI